MLPNKAQQAHVVAPLVEAELHSLTYVFESCYYKHETERMSDYVTYVTVTEAVALQESSI